MAKLFALEEAETKVETTPELEVSPEVGEVADVQVEVEADTAEISEINNGIEEGIDAADQLEQVGEVVEQAAEGEGLNPVAAEAVRIAVEAICARIGANPKSVYSLYATENFQSASSRVSNTKYALEGLGEFLKDLWERIKAALSLLWEKVKAFWNKHVSSLGRTIKALESMKAKVGSMKGAPTYEQVEVPSGLRSIFPVKARLGIDEIKEYISTVDEAEKSLENFRILETKASEIKLADTNKIVSQARSGFKIEFGNENKPMPGGVYQSWEFKVEIEKDDDIEIATLDVQEDYGKINEYTKNTFLEVANKEKLKALIDDALRRAKELAKHRDKAEKRAKDANQALKALDKEIENMYNRANADKAKSNSHIFVKNLTKSNLRTFNLIMTKGPMIEAKYFSYNLLLLKGILSYTATCIKNTRVV